MIGKKEKICIGWIDGGTVHTGFAASIAQILLHRSSLIDTVVCSSSAYLSDNRNTMVKTFLENSSADWLLSLDSDICVTLGSIDEVIRLADKDKYPVVGGKYFLPIRDNLYVSATTWDLSNPGQYSWVMNYDQKVPLENLHAVGLGYALVHRSIFENVAKMYPDNPKPWFQDEWRSDLGTWVSDDINFFEKVHKTGSVNVTLCTSATSEHIKTFRVSEDAFLSQFQRNTHAHPDPSSKKKISWWVKSKDHRK